MLCFLNWNTGYWLSCGATSEMDMMRTKCQSRIRSRNKLKCMLKAPNTFPRYESVKSKRFNTETYVGKPVEPTNAWPPTFDEVTNHQLTMAQIHLPTHLEWHTNPPKCCWKHPSSACSQTNSGYPSKIAQVHQLNMCKKDDVVSKVVR